MLTQKIFDTKFFWTQSFFWLNFFDKKLFGTKSFEQWQKKWRLRQGSSGILPKLPWRSSQMFCNALQCFVRFCNFWRTDRPTDRQTDNQTGLDIKAPSRSSKNYLERGSFGSKYQNPILTYGPKFSIEPNFGRNKKFWTKKFSEP